MRSTKKIKGIILAGGSGTRISPLTNCISKQLMPIYNKPMIYYPLSILMLCGIREILIICTPSDLDSFKRLLGDGRHLGIFISFKVQDKPKGIAEAFILGEEFLDNSPSILILGDNLFYGQNLINQLLLAMKRINLGATVFAYQVSDPERYGVINFDKNNSIKNIEEKPKDPKSNFVVTGLYFYDKYVTKVVKELEYSPRGELEISDINNIYLSKKQLNVEILGRGTAWLDTGTFDSLLEAGSFIKTIEKRQGLKVCCPEEVAWRNGWITKEDLILLSKKMNNSEYGKYLFELASQSF